MSEQELEQVLTTRLNLQAPRFDWERLPNGKLAGSIISSTFAGLSSMERQTRIWDALDAELGPQSTSLVSTLLAYTDAEWDVDLAER